MSHFLFYPNSFEYMDKNKAGKGLSEADMASIHFQGAIERDGYFPPYDGTTPNEHPFVSYRNTQSQMVHAKVD